MRCLHLLPLSLALLARHQAAAQDWNITVPKEIVILQSTKDYGAALKTAREAATRLALKLDLESNIPNRQTGLSLSKADCAGSGYEFPSYLARGDGAAANDKYISVEYSNGYQGFAKGYYIVVAAIGEPGSALVSSTCAAASRYYPDAYAKRTRVWRGCMH